MIRDAMEAADQSSLVVIINEKVLCVCVLCAIPNRELSP